MRKWTAFLVVAGCLVAGDAWALCQVNQPTPGFTGAGGSVFGRIASQWDAYFASKVGANGGTACDLTLTGTIRASGAILSGFVSATFGSLTLNQNQQPPPTAPTGTLFQGGALDGAVARATLNSFGTAGSYYTCEVSGGTNALPTATASGARLCSLDAWGYTGAGYAGPSAAVSMFAAATWGVGSTPSEIRFGTTPSGSATILDRWRIGSTGALWAETATGGAQGTGTVNSKGYYVDGVQLTAVLTATAPLTIVANAIAYPATTTNNNAAAGVIGEYISSAVVGGSAVSMSSITATNITSISLTAGDWDCTGQTVAVSTAPSGNWTGWMHTTSATFPGYPNNGGAGSDTVADGATANFARRYSLAGSATLYLSALAVFPSGSVAGYGFIGCRRAR